MAVRPIRLCGDPVLRTPAEPVVDFSRLSEVLIVTSGEDNCKPGVAGER